MTNELLKYEWSSNSPLSVMRKCGQCPWCAELEINGHDSDCAFMKPEIDLEQIKEDVRRAAWSTARELSQGMGMLPPLEYDDYGDPICDCNQPGCSMCNVPPEDDE